MAHGFVCLVVRANSTLASIARAQSSLQNGRQAKWSDELRPDNVPRAANDLSQSNGEDGIARTDTVVKHRTEGKATETITGGGGNHLPSPNDIKHGRHP